MKLYALILVLALSFSTKLKAEDDNHRFKITSADKEIFMIDGKTGKTWRFVHDYNDGKLIESFWLGTQVFDDPLSASDYIRKRNEILFKDQVSQE